MRDGCRRESCKSGIRIFILDRPPVCPAQARLLAILFQRQASSLAEPAGACGLLHREDASGTATRLDSAMNSGTSGRGQGDAAAWWARGAAGVDDEGRKKPHLHFKMPVDFMRLVDSRNFQDLYCLVLLADLIEHSERSTYMQSI